MVLAIIATKNMPKCPSCGYPRFWRLRRQHAKCKSCKQEFSLKNWPCLDIRISGKQWLMLLDSFLRDSTLLAVSRETGLKTRRLQTALTIIRKIILNDIPAKLKGPIEMDDAYVGPRWHNRRRWQRTTKRGRGTDQQPLIGIFDQSSGKVAAMPISQVRWKAIYVFLGLRVAGRPLLYTDTYSAYKLAKRHGYGHEVVDHLNGEYVKGQATVNHIEAFWGYVKRKFKITGGLRRKRLYLFLGEWVWRYNHRSWTREAKVKRLFNLLKEQKFSGKSC